MEGVYFIQNAVTGNIKIGHATNVSARLGQMQTGSDCELVLLYFMETHFPAAQEGEFHRRFDFCRIRGEWFKCEGDLKEFLKEKLGPDANVEPKRGLFPLCQVAFSENRATRQRKRGRRRKKRLLLKKSKCFKGFSVV